LKNLLNLFIVFFLVLPSIASGYRIKGLVLRTDTRAGIPLAAVILKSGTNVITTVAAGDNGSYNIEAPAGSYSLSAVSGGFYEESKNIILKSDIYLTFYMIPRSTLSLSEIDVEGSILKDTESGNSISKDLREKAPSSITGDPVHALTLMPGVNDLGMGSLSENSKLAVRGGTGNENAALLDDALVENPYHHFMGDSVFIDDIVDGIDLYKGVLPASYGQAMSSLLQVNTLDGEPGLHGKADLGLINTFLTLSGASEDQKWNFSGGIRRTDYDLIFPLLVQGGGTNFHVPYYLDSQGKIQYKDERDIISLVWLYSEEPMSWTNLALSESSLSSGNPVSNSGNINYNEALANIDWKHSFSRAWSVDQSVGSAWNGMDWEMHESDNSTLMKDDAFNLRYKGSVTFAPSEDVSFDAGGEVIYYPSLYYTSYIAGMVTNQLTGQPDWMIFGNNSFQGSMGIYSAFIENDSQFFDKNIYVEDGLRFNYVDYIKKYSFDPRLTVGYRFAPQDKVYACAGYLSEFPADAFDLAVLDTGANLNIPGCWHYILGTGLEFNRVYDISIEGYFKNYENYMSQESNIEYLLQTTGEQRQVYGVDILITKKRDSVPLYGWLSMSSYFVRGYRTSGFDPNSLENLGPGSIDGGPSVTVAGQVPDPPLYEWFDPGSLLYKVDLVVIWEINKNWTLTSEFQWQSGNQYTPLQSVQTNTVNGNTVYTPVWSEYNSAWLPDQHCMNLKIEYDGEIFNLPSGIYLEVNNVYNYRPVIGVSYSDNYNTVTMQQNPIGIYPELGVWMKW